MQRPDTGQAGMPPTIVVQGSSDSTVRAINGELVTVQWLVFHEAFLADPVDPDRIVRSTRTTGRPGKGRGYVLTRWYTARGRKRLEAWHIHGLGHAWSGGHANGSCSDPREPLASTLMWRFFSAQRLTPAFQASRQSA